MPALNFSDAQTINGVNGKIYIFNARTFNVYKVQGVFIYTIASTPTWEAINMGTFSALFALLSSTAPVVAPYLFSYYFGDNALYIFAATSVDSGSNKVILKRKRGFKRVFSIGSIFDVADEHFPVLIDYVEQIYASVDGRRPSKETISRIADFEDALAQNLEPE